MGRKRVIYSNKTLNAIEKSSANKKISIGIFLSCFNLLVFLIMFAFDKEFAMYFIFLLVPDIFFGIYIIYCGIKQNKKEKIFKQQLFKSIIQQVDLMSGKDFEFFIASILENLGYSVNVTKQTRDFGADIIIEKNLKRIVVQTKRYSKKVSLSAIQEAYSSMIKYKATQSWVVTNNFFTQSAIELANTNNVVLIDRYKLIDLINQNKKMKNI